MAREPDEAPGEPRRRPFRRVALLLLASVTIVGIVAVIAQHVYEANRRGALTLSDNLLDTLERRVEAQLVAYLAPAEHLAESIRNLLEERSLLDDGQRTMRVASRGALLASPQIAAVLAADRDGNFLFVQRNPEGGIATKVVDMRGGNRRVYWNYRDEQGRNPRQVEDPADPFDPRTRPWFIGAMQTGKPFWTDVYIFHTSRKPGITLGLPDVEQPGAARLITGVDIELDELSRFLQQLGIGVQGRALIITEDGYVIAYPGATWPPAAQAEKLVLPRLDELGDPVLERAYNRMRVDRPRRQVIAIDDQRVIITAEPLKLLTGRNWILVMVVPEQDFVGFIAASGRVAGLLSLGALAVVVGMTTFLAWQGVRADRRAAAATLTQRALQTLGEAFARLSQIPSLHDPDDPAALSTATELAAKACAVRRVSVWRITAKGRVLDCEDCYDTAGGGHIAGADLHREEIGRFFAAIETGERLRVEHADADRRTSELARLYLTPLGIESVQVFPIRDGENTIGVLLFEGRLREAEANGAEQFGTAFASLLTLRFVRAHGDGVAPLPRPSEPAPVAEIEAADEVPERPAPAVGSSHLALQQLALQAIPADDDRVRSFMHAPVLALALPDWLCISARTGAESLPTLDRIARLVQQVGGGQQLEYAAILDNRALLAGFPPAKAADATLTARSAAAALELRDALQNLSDELERDIAFGLGLDVGVTFLGRLGQEPAISNIWGPAVHGATSLAATAAGTSIVVSESAYRQLGNDYLFRPAGRFLVPEVGVIATYTLIGRL